MKKILIMALALLLAFGANAAVSVRMDNGAVLLDPLGKEIVSPGSYDDIVPLGQDRFAALTDGSCALMNAAGDLLTGAVYSDLYSAGKVFIACRDGLWGLLDADGAALTPFEYTRVVFDDSGAIWALKTDPADQDSDELILLDTNGAERETGMMVRRMGEAACGRIAVQIGLLWGFCDGDGNLAVAAEYDSVGVFTAGIAPVAGNGKYGAVDLNGNLLLPLEYDSLEISASGLMIASRAEEGVFVFSGNGAPLAHHAGAESFAAAAGEGYALFTPEQTRLFDSEGTEILTASAGASFSEGLNGQVIVSDGAWGDACVFIAGTETRYQNLLPLGTAGESALYACMEVNASRYMNDLLGEMQLAVDMDSVRWGVADENGALLLPAEYESVRHIGDDRLLTCIGGQWQMIDSAGAVYWTHGIMQSEAPSF